MKSKIRIRKGENEGIYVVKTSKFISEEDSVAWQQKHDEAKAHQKLKRKASKTKNQNL